MPTSHLDFSISQVVLRSAGIPLSGTLVENFEQGLLTAAKLGYPVVLKVISPDIVHKSDAGIVALNVKNEAELHEQWNIILRRAADAGAKQIQGVLVQKQAAPGFELLIGGRQDPAFGPCTMVGSGGRLVELLRDVAMGVGELTEQDVERMLADTKAGTVIAGFRGPPLDKKAVIDLVLKVSWLMSSRPDITELDLNPVIIYESGLTLVDVRIVFEKPQQRPTADGLSAKRIQSLGSIFEARSVAVVGASKPGTVGGILLKNISTLPKVYPINPKRDSLLGYKCYPDLTSIPEVPEVAVFAVSPEATISGFREFCERGGKGAVILSDGFAEIGRSSLEKELQDISRAHDVVYIGPNGLGVLDNFSGMNTMFLPGIRCNLPDRPGPIGVISQSGGIGLELLEMAAGDRLTVGKWVSCGNSSGASIAELLAHMGDDPRIKIIAIYLEGLSNGVEFLQVGRQVAAKKPVLVIKGGMAGGAEATLTHTASLAGSFEVFRAACKQAGLYLLEELTEDPRVLINTLSILTTQVPARNDRVGVVSVGGGAGIVIADQLTTQGLKLASFSDESKSRLAELFGEKLRRVEESEKRHIEKRLVLNPIDLCGDSDDDRLLEAIRILNRDPNVDLLVAAIYFQIPYLSEYVAERLVELQPELNKPLIISPRGHSAFIFRKRQYMINRDVPTYTVPMVQPLVLALDIWMRYGTDFRSEHEKEKRS